MSVLIFLLILSVLVLVHELGHYVAARIFGVKAEEFGYGFPPRAVGFVRVDTLDRDRRVVSKKWKRVSGSDQTAYENTVWSVNWLPLGGFVRLKGETGDGTDQKDSFQSKPGWQKFIILAAGVFMNWLLASMIFAFGFASGVPAELAGLPQNAIVQDKRIEITDVVAGSAALEAGLRAGDYVISFNATTPANAEEARALLKTYDEKTPVTIKVKRDGEEKSLTATAKYLPELDRAAFGVGLTDIGTVKFPFFTAIGQGFVTATSYAGAIVAGFGQLISDLFSGGGQAADVSGPVGIAIITGQVSERGFWAIMQFTAILSLNLAVINFLPIPALDGGRALFVIFEGLRRKKHDPRVEAAIHQVGFIVLLVLILLVTLQDLRKHGSSIWHGLLGVFGI
jgi:regulator of sigma E protease